MDILKKIEHLDFRAVYFARKHLILCLLNSYEFSNIKNIQVYLLTPSERRDIVVESSGLHDFLAQFLNFEHPGISTPEFEHRKLNTTKWNIKFLNFKSRFWLPTSIWDISKLRRSYELRFRHAFHEARVRWKAGSFPSVSGSIRVWNGPSETNVQKMFKMSKILGYRGTCSEIPL